MATLVLAAAGAAVGGAIGGTAFGLGAAVIGRAVGATLGQLIDARFLGGSQQQSFETGRIERFRLTGASEGAPIPQVFGRVRVGGQVIWASRFDEISRTSGGGGGKGGGRNRSPRVTEYSYTVSLALGLCEGEILRVGRVWADGIELSREDLGLRVYKGSEKQNPDPKIEAVEGAGRAPAYRGLAYVVLEDLDLSPYGNRVPQFSFEVVRVAEGGDAGLSDTIRAVALMPGTGEYALATTPVHQELGPGRNRTTNVHTPGARTDMDVSLDTLIEELPRCNAASLIVSWFGDDLRCGSCSIAPKVEQQETEGEGMPWRVSGVSRSAAGVVPYLDGRPAYGGTPTDRSVMEAIAALKARGQTVMFYPFILMDQEPGNTLVDPYTGLAGQPVFPWRGRITTSVAPGRSGSPDGTSAAAAEVAAFFGNAGVDDFVTTSQGVSYTGPEEFSFRRFILHYAHLVKAAGGVEAFCIGSEMRGLSTIRGAGRSYPAVEALRQLAADVRQILGPAIKISYAADWSEYFGHQPQDNSGDRVFHLDPLWAHPDIDFIGIDNYMPLSDWRDGFEHEDAKAGSVYDLDYLKGNVEGGEGYDWYYASPEGAEAQIRTPITDGAYDEPWVFRYKDLNSWWSQRHFNRYGGVRESAPTAWQPRSKPFWFTELGCAAIDRGTNQPNKFLDPKSSESKLPVWSGGGRDDLVQLQYYRAVDAYWGDPSNNPISPVYGGHMVDMSRAFAWAWDARPFPRFPSDRDLWSDGDNFARGHWLNGRSGATDLAAVVREVASRAGLEYVETDWLHGLVKGYVARDVVTARSTLEPLLLAARASAVDRDGALRFQNRQLPPVAELNRDEFVDAEGGIVEHTRLPDAEVPRRVQVSFVEAELGFETRTVEANEPDAETSPVAARTELPMSLTGTEARGIAEDILAAAQIGRDRVRFALPLSVSDVGAGDIVKLDGDSFRVDGVELTDFRTVEAVRTEVPISGNVFDVGAGAPKASTVANVPVLPLVLDLPLLTGDEEPHAPHIAVAADPWPGEVAAYASRTGASFDINTLVRAPARIGRTLSPLARARPARWDLGPGLRVDFGASAVLSASQEDVLAGANIAAIGQEGGLWEVFQFADADEIAPEEWLLSRRLRGQLGTDAVMPDVWPEGSLVVIWDAALQQLDVPSSARGTEMIFRTGPAARPVDDPVFVESTAAIGGVGLRPLSPVHLRARRDGDDWRLSWIRRTRFDGDLWSVGDVPLGEAREEYLVRILAEGRLVREVSSDVAYVTYSSAERASDGVTGPFSFEVAQVSDRFGPGPFSRIEVDG